MHTKRDIFSNLDFLPPHLPYYKQTFPIVLTLQSVCGSWEKSGTSPALSRNCQNVHSHHSLWSNGNNVQPDRPLSTALRGAFACKGTGNKHYPALLCLFTDWSCSGQSVVFCSPGKEDTL
jgi:hypothetical protein